MHNIYKFKDLTSAVLNSLCEIGQYTPTCHVMDHLTERVSQFDVLELLDSCGFETFNEQETVHITQHGEDILWPGEDCAL